MVVLKEGVRKSDPGKGVLAVDLLEEPTSVAVD
jgi:hypothetical protein